MRTNFPVRRLAVGDRAPNPEILDSDGQPLSLERLWTRRPVVLSFMRHFG
jgi:peroxiredoxin